MKPRSYIFCALAIILIIAGIITCIVAGGMASTAGVELFEGKVDENGNTILIKDLTGRSISTFSLSIEDANVNIIGGADKSSLELVNFRPNFYSFSFSNRTFNFSDSLNALSFFNFGGDGAGFKGLRYYFTSKGNGADKSVNIYIDDSSALNIVDVDVKNGNISVSGLNESISYTLTAENGDIEMQSVISNREGDLTCGMGNVLLKDTYIKKLRVDIDDGEFEEILATTGRNSYDLATNDGTIYVGGADQGKEYEAVSPSETSKVYVTVKKGDIIIDAR